MHVTYTPADGDKQEWHFDPDEVWEDDAEAIEKVADCAWDNWVIQLRRGSSRVRRSLLWYLQRQEHPSLRFDDLPRFRKRDLLIEFDVADLATMREQFATSPRLSEDERTELLAETDLEIEKARAKFGDTGKAPSPDVELSISSPSPKSSESDPGS